MANIRRALNPVQFGILVELEKELRRVEELVVAAQGKRAMIYELVLDALQVQGAQDVKLNTDTRELLITVLDPVLPAI